MHDKLHPIWIWVAFERETKRIVGLAFGDGSSETCKELWQSLPADDRKRAVCYTDFWDAYGVILPSTRHHAVGLETGETAHVERLNNTLRQRAGPRCCCAQDNGARIWFVKPCRSVSGLIGMRCEFVGLWMCTMRRWRLELGSVNNRTLPKQAFL